MVLFGVGESRSLIGSLKSEGYRVAAVARTEYGGSLAGVSGADHVAEAPSGAVEMVRVIRELGVRQVIDATHPFASQLSAVAAEACASVGIPYLRYGRGETQLPGSSPVHRVYSWEEAAEAAANYGDTVFLTTGSNNLEVFLRSPGLSGRRIVVRVLPEYKVIKKCRDLGISPRDIVAMQGPFSVKLNKAIFQAYRAGVIITRDGGPSGGTYNKLRAASELKIPVILIQREKISAPVCYGDMESLLEAVRSNFTDTE